MIRDDELEANAFLEDHLAGKHQAEIAALLTKIEPVLVGHSRIIIAIAAIRLIAAMLGPAKRSTQERMLKAVPETLGNILDVMNKELPNSGD
jgi:hypothetical protein